MKHAPILIIIVLAALVRIANIDRPLWYDEAYTARMAQLPIAQMLAETVKDVHPPTWYIIEHASVSLFGLSESALRIPSLALGVLAVYLVYRLVRQLAGQTPGLVAAGLTTVNAMAVYYSTEARMYSLLLVCVTSALIGAVENKRWLLGLGTAATLLTHNTAVIYLPIIALAALMQKRSIRQLVPIALGSVPFAAWVPTLISQATTGQFESSYWISNFTGNNAARLISEMTRLWFPGTVDWLLRTGMIVAMALAVFPVASAARSRSRNGLLLAALAFLPGLASLAISVTWQPIILARTLIGCLPGWTGLIAWWVTQKRKWTRPRIALIGAAACAVFASLVGVRTSNPSEHILRIIQYLNYNAGQTDIVCQTSDSASDMFRFYYHGNSVPIDRNACDWVVYEKYITSDAKSITLADQAIAHGDMIMSAYESPVLTSRLYKLWASSLPSSR